MKNVFNPKEAKQAQKVFIWTPVTGRSYEMTVVADNGLSIRLSVQSFPQ